MSLRDHEEVLVSEYIDVPPWIEEDISVYDIASIVQGGCASGAYMPAVTYYQARQTMNDWEDQILNFLDEHEVLLHDIAASEVSESWSGLACSVVSYAVEIWAASIEEELLELIEEDKDNE